MGLHIGGGVGPVRYGKRIGGKGRRGRQASVVEETAEGLRFGTFYYLPAFVICFVVFLIGTSQVFASVMYALFVAIPVSIVLAVAAAIVRAVQRRS